MVQSIRKGYFFLVVGLLLLGQAGCAGPSDVPFSAPDSQSAAVTSSGPAAPIEEQPGIILQPSAEATLTGTDGFAPDDLAVITPENAGRLRELAVIGPGQFLSEMAMAPDGESLTVAASNGVMVFDPDTGDLVDFYTSPSSGVISMALSPDGRWLATITRMQSEEYYPASSPYPESHITYPVLSIWDRTTDEKVLTQPLDGRGCGDYLADDLRFTPDGTELVFRDYYSLIGYAKSDNLCVVSAEDGSLLQTIPIEVPWTSRDGIAIADEGRSVVVTVTQMIAENQLLTRARRYDLDSGELLQEFEITGGWNLNELALSPDERWLAVTTEQGVQLYAMADGRPITTIGNEDLAGTAVAFSPDGETLAISQEFDSLSLVSMPDALQIWEKPIVSLVHIPTLQTSPAYGMELIFSPDGDRLIGHPLNAGGWTTDFIQVLDPSDGREVTRIYAPNDYIHKRLSPDSSRALFAGFQNGEIQLWSVPGNQLLWSADEHTNMVVDQAFSPDGRQVATASLDGSVRLWSASDGALTHTLSEDLGPTWRVAYASDGEQLASLSGDGTLRLWNPATGDLVKEIPTGVLAPWQGIMAYTSDSEAVLVASGCRVGACVEYPDAGLRRVDLASGEVTLIVGYPVYQFALSADQSLAGLFTAYGTQSWDMRTLQATRSYSSPFGTRFLNGVGISPDGRLLLSGNGFGLHVWDNSNGQLLSVIQGTVPFGEIAFSADQRLVSVSGLGMFSVWGVPAR